MAVDRDEPQVESELGEGKLSDFRPLETNPNRHTERGLAMLEDAMGECGYVAPMTVAADGEMLDGSARIEKAFESFGDECLIVRHDGQKPIVMVREDVPDAQSALARRIIYLANRTVEIDLSWDAEQIAADLAAGLDLGGLFFEGELEELLEGFTVEDYSDLDEVLEELEGYEEVDVRITVPGMYKDQVVAWLANGESETAPGMGKGVLRRCGLL